MDEKTERMLNTILYGSLFFIFILLLFQNMDDPWVVVLLSGILIISVTFRNAVLYSSGPYSGSGRILMIFDVLIISFIGMLDKSGNYGIYYFIVIGDAVLSYSAGYSISLALLCYIALAAEYIIKQFELPINVLLVNMAFQLLIFAFVIGAMMIIKYEISQRVKLKETMTELKIKTKQLENTYFKLKETSRELEEMTILKERNRIAREVHDTVGHTLTTALIEMEAGEQLIKINPELAAEKIRLAKSQARKGLNDIRESVRTLQSGREMLEFVPSLKLLIDDTILHSSINIKSDIRELPEISEAHQKAIYRALQEGLTNGIRHGKSTAFIFMLRYEDGHLKFFLQDNGSGTEKIIPGFGLTSMEERVKELGGIFSAVSEPGEGFTISIIIPIEQR